MKTILEAIKEQGIAMPDQVWDYWLVAPCSVNDLPYIMLSYQEQEGDHWVRLEIPFTLGKIKILEGIS